MRRQGLGPRPHAGALRHPGSRATAGRALALALVAFLLYANTLGHGYALDDEIAVAKNSLVQKGVAGLGGIFTHGYLYGFNGLEYFYRPLGLASLALEVQVFGNNPRAHHAVNVVLFALSVALLYLFLERLLGGGARPARAVGAAAPWLIPAFAVLLFAAHPIHTEVVANIKSRDELLAFFFGLSTLHLVLSHADSRNPRALIASLVCYFLAALSKETGLAVVGLIPLTLWYFRTSNLRHTTLVTLPFLGVAALSLLLRHTFAGGALSETDASDLINNALLSAPTAAVWIASRIAVLGRYLWLLVVPYPLSYDYSYNQVPLVGPSDWRFLLSLGAHIVLLATAVWGFLRKHVIGYAIAFYAVLLLPVSNLALPLGTVMGERLIFGSSVGFCLALGWFVVWVGGYFHMDRARYGLMALLVVIYGGLTIARNRDWKNSGTLFASGLRTSPHSARVQNHYGSFLRERAEGLSAESAGRVRGLKEALRYYNRALEILPAYDEARYNMGITWLDLGSLDSAEVCFQKTLAIDSVSTGALNYLGVIHYRRGEYEEARVPWLKLTRVDPRSAMAFFSLGGSYFEQGHEFARRGEGGAALDAYRQAAACFEKAYVLNPAWPQASAMLWQTYLSLGDSARAAVWQARMNRAVTGAPPGSAR